MHIFKSNNINKEYTVDKKALMFGLISTFLCGIGFGIINPVIPFLVQPYISSPEQQAIVVTLLMSAYAICVFFTAPTLGALSDRYGRRPLLLICLFCSAIGYIILGTGGALWILFVGRIIEGIAGGSISAIFAYFADITPKEHRIKYFGWISAVVGAGTVIGPTIGGLLAKFGYSVPMYAGAIITLLNVVYGILYMPESLHKNNRLKKITFVRLNPFIQLVSILSMKSLKRLLFAASLLWIANGSLQSIFSQFTIDTFNWQPAIIGLMFSIIGIQDIISQGFIMPKLLIKFKDSQIVILGMVSEVIAYILIAASAIFSFYPFLIAGMFIFGFGDSIFAPSFSGIVSKSVDSNEQGRIQGGIQSIQALGRIIGPIVGGQIYVLISHTAPAFMSMILILVAIIIFKQYTRKITQ